MSIVLPSYGILSGFCESLNEISDNGNKGETKREQDHLHSELRMKRRGRDELSYGKYIRGRVHISDDMWN